jgi:hypothetical protein
VFGSSSQRFQIGAIKASDIFQLNTKDLKFDLSNAVAKFGVTAKGGGKSYAHETWFAPVPLSKQQMADPKLSLSYDKGMKEFVVECNV